MKNRKMGSEWGVKQQWGERKKRQSTCWLFLLRQFHSWLEGTHLTHTPNLSPHTSTTTASTHQTQPQTSATLPPAVCCMHTGFQEEILGCNRPLTLMSWWRQWWHRCQHWCLITYSMVVWATSSKSVRVCVKECNWVWSLNISTPPPLPVVLVFLALCLCS